MPFVTTVRDGVTPSSIPAMNEFHHSFVVSNYAADGGCLDNVSLDLHSDLCSKVHCELTYSLHPPPFPPSPPSSLFQDDGSAYYHISYNFCVAGGHKSDFDGHGKVRKRKGKGRKKRGRVRGVYTRTTSQHMPNTIKQPPPPLPPPPPWYDKGE